MHSLARNLTQYFRDSLIDELILDEVGSPKGANTYTTISPEQFERGALPAKLAEGLLGDQDELRLLIAPMQLKRGFFRDARHWRQPEVITPMLVPCVLSRDGKLAAQERIMPWFIRDYLDPVVSADSVVISSVDDVEEFIARNSQDFACTSWQEYHSFCSKMLQDLIGFDADGRVQLGHAAYFACNEPRVYLDSGQGGATSNIKKLYDSVLKKKDMPKAYESFVAGCSAPRALLTLEEEVDVAAHSHLGQMSGAFGLGASQRETIHHFLSINEGEVLAVNGPPGTGKTTLLQSAIASLWVKAIMVAGNDYPDPPVIVATSSNNQAVTNVIRDFGEVLKLESDNPLEMRWLPEGVGSLGTYAVAEARQKKLESEDNRLLCVSLAWVSGGYKLKGFFEKTESPEFIGQAVTTYLEMYERFSGASMKREAPAELVKAIRKELRRRMLHIAADMQETLASWKRCRQDVERKAETEKNLTGLKTSLRRCTEASSAKATQLIKAGEELTRTGTVAMEAASTIAGQPFWESLLGALGFVKERRRARAKAFTLKHGLEMDPAPQSLHDVEKHVDDLLDTVKKRHKALSRELDELQRAAAGMEQEKGELKALLQGIAGRASRLAEILGVQECELDFTRAGLYRVLDQFDRNARFEMFLLAVHYYEGLWLEHMLRSENGKVSGKDRLKRLAMLTPCIVSTLFMVPKFFSESGAPLYEFVDLLILDEAGQAGPDKAAAVFALAKRGLVVGDVHQIEPVYKIPVSVDLGNLKRNNVYVGREEEMPRAVAVSKGSAMRMAQDASPYHCILNGHPAEERGMYLLEHRRCHKDIIGYCKELVYPHLEVLTRQEPDDFYLFPPLGYAHIPSSGQKKGGSWCNPYEAHNIAQWLADNRDRILARYKASSLASVIAIVTPFARQVSSLRESMQGCLPESDYAEMVVGTVHKLQGAERPIIVFSPVYGPGNVAVPFFDRGRNMLNVAVSRAKHSFLVFGNMALFDPGNGRPSGILGKHLQCNMMAGELDGFRLAPRPIQGRIEHLTTLDQHRETLRKAFETVREQLVIVSPFITRNALKADNVLEMIRSAVGRGAAVDIYSDSRLALSCCQNQQAALDDLAQAIRDAGARIEFKNGVHNKTLIVDKHTLVEGSFNWLSARRDDLARREHSISYHGIEAGALMEDILPGLSESDTKG